MRPYPLLLVYDDGAPLKLGPGAKCPLAPPLGTPELGVSLSKPYHVRSTDPLTLGLPMNYIDDQISYLM